MKRELDGTFPLFCFDLYVTCDQSNRLYTEGHVFDAWYPFVVLRGSVGKQFSMHCPLFFDKCLPCIFEPNNPSSFFFHKLAQPLTK